MKADNVKQGSGPEFCAMDQLHINVHINGGEDYVEMMVNYYNWLLDEGVAPEQARMVLPQSMFTEVIATGNLYAWANLYLQRSDSHAQKETQEVAKQIGDIIQPLFPVSWEALTK
jgi:thymidylate synthase (FAD)